MDTCRDCASLRQQIEMLQLAIGIMDKEPIYRRSESTLSKTQAIILRMLRHRDWVPYDAMHYVIYSDRPEPDDYDHNNVSVQVCHLRRKLRAIGVTVENIWGRGARIPPDSKKLLDKFDS